MPIHAQTPSAEPQLSAATLPIVNGHPYHQPTVRDNLRSYQHTIIGTRPVLHAAIRGAFEQIRPVPVGWGQDFPGYLQRFGSAYGEAAIDNSTRYGLGTIFHEDVRYLICHQCSAPDKLRNAFLYEVTTRHGRDGHRVFSPTPFIADYSGPAVAYAAWYPPGYTQRMALGHAVFDIATRFVFNTAREFLFDRDRKPAYDKNGRDLSQPQ